MKHYIIPILAVLFAIGASVTGSHGAGVFFGFGLGFAVSEILTRLAAWWAKKDAEIMERFQLFEEREQ